MSVSLNRLSVSSPLIQRSQELPKEKAAQSVAVNDFCATMQVLNWSIQMEFDQIVRGDPDFDKIWKTVLEMPLDFPTLKARILLPFVIAEGGDVWHRLLHKLNDPKYAAYQEQLLDIYAWLLKYPEIPRPAPDYKGVIEQIQSRFQPAIPDDEHWQQLDVSDEDDVITQISAAALLATERQLGIIWEKLKERKMDSGKAQILIACLWFFPPRFWQERVDELGQMPFNLLPSTAVKHQLIQIVNSYQTSRVKIIFFEGILDLTRSKNCNAVMKGLFNLFWARKDELDLARLDLLMRFIETPLELREVALYINENYQRFKAEGVASVIVKKAFLKDSMAIYLSDAVVRDVVDFGMHLDIKASDEEIVSTIKLFAHLATDLNKMIVSPDRGEWFYFLEIFPIYLLWLERFPRAYLSKQPNVIVDIILKLAPLLARLRQDAVTEREVFGAFFRRSKRLMKDAEFEKFVDFSLSLSNNFYGESVYKSRSILKIMDKELVMNGEGWFKSNEKAFQAIMEADDLLDSTSALEATWISILPVYKQYVSIFPSKKNWIATAIAFYVNHFPRTERPEVLDELLKCLDRSCCPIDILKQAVTPGPSIMALLKKVEELSSGLPGSSSQQMFDWANALLRKNDQDEQFWIEAKSLYQSIVAKIPKPKRRKKGSQGTQFATVWSKFDKKINESHSSEALLRSIIDQKRAEVRLQANQRFVVALALYQNRYEAPFAGIIAEGDEVRLKNEALGKILELINHMPQDVKGLDLMLEEELETLHQIKSRSELEKKLVVVSEAFLKEAEIQASQLEKKIDAIGSSVLEQMRQLKRNEPLTQPKIEDLTEAVEKYCSLLEESRSIQQQRVEIVPLKLKEQKKIAKSHKAFNALMGLAKSTQAISRSST